jgi:hypothetical protein
MDQKSLEQFIEKYAEYIYHTDPGSDVRKNPCSHNPKAMIVILKMKPQPSTCKDCGKSCDDHVTRCISWDFKKLVWNQRCLSCKRSLNHETHKFEYAAKKSNIRPTDPVTKKFLKKQLADQSTTDGQQDANHVDQD